MPAVEKEDYHVLAGFEEGQRHEAMQIPLATKSSPKPDIEAQVGGAALKKMSAGRLQQNFLRAEQHALWSSPCQLGDCAWVLPNHVFQL